MLTYFSFYYFLFTIIITNMTSAIKNLLRSYQAPVSIDLNRMLRSSHSYSSNTRIPHHQQPQTPSNYRWKVNNSPPILRRPSTIRHTVSSEKKLSNASIHPSIAQIAYSLQKRPYGSAKSQRMYTKHPNGQYYTHRPRVLSGRTSIEQYQRTMKMKNSLLKEQNSEQKNLRLVVPKVWRALKSNRPKTKKKIADNLKELLEKNFMVGFDDDFLFNKGGRL